MYYRSYDDKVNPREKCIKDINYIKVCMATKFLMMACWLTYSGNIISFLTFSSKKKTETKPESSKCKCATMTHSEFDSYYPTAKFPQTFYKRVVSNITKYLIKFN